jgi:mono/diheme cytochrome c family protein
MTFLLTVCIAFLGSIDLAGAELPDWSAGARISTPRVNPYGLPHPQWDDAIQEGRLHSLEYPVDISGVLLPWEPFRSFLDETNPNPIRLLLQKAFSGFSKIQSTDDLFKKIGLHTYPEVTGHGPYDIPRRTHDQPRSRMGVTLFEKNGVEVFTISCAACHTASLFGKKVLGMTNRFPKANEFFSLGKKAAGLVGPQLFADVLGANAEETAIYRRLRANSKYVGAKKPAAVGLDTSLSQVALSLARRDQDEVATKNPLRAHFPRPEVLSHYVADSKPAVWWNVKYKNRWLSDGSVISGNPIYTNILWNELGRGTDLEELENWLDANPKTIQSLTAAVFATEAPRYTDFFAPSSISIDRAKKGEVIFENKCAKCHGSYVKAWSLDSSSSLSDVKLIETIEVQYPEKTLVKDVGTDPQRAIGMKSLELLNPLRISKKNNVVIQAQKGYVPPPLVGIWARWPYLHNNSVPSLCALLSPVHERPPVYYAGEAVSTDQDFDIECNGYPLGDRTPKAWTQNPEMRFDTSLPGLSNQGHEMIVSGEDRVNLIQFLKTL